MSGLTPHGDDAPEVRPTPGGRKPGTDEPPEIKVSLSDAIGGPRGVVDTTLPTIAFVAVNSAAGLTAAIVAALVVGVAIFILRLVRSEPKQQAFSGLFAVGIAAFFASRTKSSKGFFLPSILKNAVAIAIGVGSMLARRPLAGYVMAAFDQRYADWRDHRDTMRAANWATGVWIVVYILRFGVQGIFYLAGQDGWLAAANLVLGLPLFGIAVVATLAIVRKLAPAARFAPPDDAPDGQGPTDPAPSRATILEKASDD
ncbi:DUF3159 domain-containing protein [Frankia sp. CNm7]|uniref:DUF3159 domain-containing protein n=1 Tax=Frankia nepalensis TaxID=1836974 RepID=A0A937US41_9ACTN|nr:DUF3159 domain-containing protein [Frankia nepalensis]MBL7499348.1 DUF3159 domain-containing protein [Frankia nepalensis]MBL7515204.1 DUF3159 domain-containing protein [Frankia nepalensis]MBL7524009.1 DUF3159 domain-containing protein [Frankia nepalensis]MBL7629880.1 DUF3159 domain-containing protein [Frankia nepalensis]